MSCGKGGRGIARKANHGKGTEVIAGIMQPTYLPWKGFFGLMHRCDVFVYFDDVQYTLKAQSSFFRAFELLQGDQRIGVIKPDHVFTRKMTVDLPETMPLTVRLFIIWLVIVMWKRAAQSSS